MADEKDTQPLTQNTMMLTDKGVQGPMKMPSVKHMASLVKAKDKAKLLKRGNVIKPKRTSAKTFFLGTASGQLVGLAIMAIFLILFGACAWIWSGGNADYGANFREGLWLSWGVFFDPGTQTGLAGDEEIGPQLVAVLFSITGFMFNLVALGLIVDFVRAKLETWKALYGKLVLNNHIVVLGWSDKTIFLLAELSMMLGEGNSGPTPGILNTMSFGMSRTLFGELKRVAVLGDRPVEAMMLDVETHLPRFSHRVDLVQGKAFDVDSLDRVCIETASVVLLLGASREPDVADSLSITTLLALHALMVSPQALLVAELQLSQSVDVVSGIFGTRRISFEVIGVTTSTIADQAMALLSLQPAAGMCLLEICDYLGDDLNLSPVVGQLKLSGQPFSRAASLDRLNHCVILGIVSVKGKLTIAPEPGRLLQATDRLLLISADGKQSEGGESLINNFGGDSTGLMGKLMSCCSKKIEPPDMLVKTRDRLRGIPFVRPFTTEPKVVIVLGWGPCIGSLLRSLDCRLPEGSKVYILSKNSAEDREEQLKADGIGQADGGLAAATVIHEVGTTTLQPDLSRLPLEEACSILIVGDARGQESQIMDSETIVTVEILQQLRAKQESDNATTKKTKFGKNKEGKNSAQARSMVIVAQFQDFLTMRMFQADKQLLQTASSRDNMQVIPFHRNSVETGALAVSAQLPALGRALEALTGLEVRVRGVQGVLQVTVEAIGVDQLIKPHELSENRSSTRPLTSNGLSFKDLSDRAGEAGRGVVIGWARAGGGSQIYEIKRGDGSAPGITMNPREKGLKLMWYAGDQIIVANAKDTRPAGQQGEAALKETFSKGIGNPAMSGEKE